MQNRKVYAIWTNQDLTEGRGQEYVKSYAEMESTARRLAKKNYVQGTDCPITEETFLFQEGQWYAPGPRLEAATPEDIEEEKKKSEDRLKARRFDAAWRKAMQVGLTEEDLDILSKRVL